MQAELDTLASEQVARREEHARRRTLSVAAIAAGADGLLIEVIAEDTVRIDVLCDGDQGIRPDALRRIVRSVRLAREVHRKVCSA